MNQKQIQNEPVFFDAPVKINAKHYRTAARAKLTGIFGIAILVTFLASLLGGLSGGGFGFDFNASADNDTVSFTLSAEELILFASIVIAVAVITLVAVVAFSIFVGSPVKLGYHRFFLEAVDENLPEIRVQTLFRFFKEGYFKSVGLNVLYSLLKLVAFIPMLASAAVGVYLVVDIIALEDLLYPSVDTLLSAILMPTLIISGGALITLILLFLVIYPFGYAFTIMADCPQAGAVEALRTSRTLMKGRKWDLFCLDFSFIGWYILGALLLGIGVLLVYPYHYMARTLFYHDIAQRDAAKDVEFPSIDPDEGEIADFPVKPASMPAESAEPTATPDGISTESLESIEFPSLDLDDDD